MAFSKETLAKAFAIFLRLLDEGEILAEERELFTAYQDPEVREVLEDVIELQAQVKILAGPQGIYLSPAVENRLFGYANEQLRSAMGLRNNSELYLAYFTILCLLAMLYNSDDQLERSREFIPVEELEGYVSAQVERLAAADREDVSTLEDDLEINLASVADLWLDLPPYDDTLKNLNLGRNNRISFLLRVLRFLEAEGLVQIFELREIRPLPKFDRIITHYYFHSSRKERILHMIRKPIRLLPAPEVIAGAED